MFNIGAGEFVVIALLALIVLGPERLPGAARFVGQVMGSMRSMASNFQEEMERASGGSIEQAAREKGRLLVEQDRSYAAVDSQNDSDDTSADGTPDPAVAATSEPDGEVTNESAETPQPDRTEKPQSAPMYPVNSSAAPRGSTPEPSQSATAADTEADALDADSEVAGSVAASDAHPADDSEDG